jgi:hypothetical protein
MKADPVVAHVAPVFWSLTMNAHLDVAQLVAAKLFDQQNGAMTVEYEAPLKPMESSRCAPVLHEVC